MRNLVRCKTLIFDRSIIEEKRRWDLKDGEKRSNDKNDDTSSRTIRIPCRRRTLQKRKVMGPPSVSTSDTSPSKRSRCRKKRPLNSPSFASSFFSSAAGSEAPPAAAAAPPDEAAGAAPPEGTEASLEEPSAINYPTCIPTKISKDRS
jgi:hypothetical protein